MNKNVYLVVIFSFFGACTKTSYKVAALKNESLRKPAQVESYLSCRPVDEELLIESVDFSRLDTNYENVKNTIFKNNCASCHFGKDSYLPHLDDYDMAVSYANSGKLLKTIESGKMPPSSPLDYDAQNFIKSWIKLGAPY
jgi:hypothetical protein